MSAWPIEIREALEHFTDWTINDAITTDRVNMVLADLGNPRWVVVGESTQPALSEIVEGWRVYKAKRDVLTHTGGR